MASLLIARREKIFYFLNAIIERIFMIKCTIAIRNNFHSELYDKLKPCFEGFEKLSFNVDNYISRLKNSDPALKKLDIAIYNTVTQSFVYNTFPKKNAIVYQNFYDGNGFISAKYMQKGLDVTVKVRSEFAETGKYEPFSSTMKVHSDSRYVITTTDLSVMNDYQIMQNLIEAYFLSFNRLFPNMTIVQGVPGCGKTTRAIRDYDEKTAILTSTREATKDVRRRLVKKAFPNAVDEKFIKIQMSEHKSQVRTTDSFIINHQDIVVEFEKVIIDEALMRHPGEVAACAILSAAKSVFLIGDVAQIPFVNRISSFDHAFKGYPLEISEYLPCSYRCPPDVIYKIRKSYPGVELQSKNAKSMRTCSLIPFRSFNDVPLYSEKECISKGYHYLVFKQSEKKEMINKLKHNMVSTVHEFQGNQAKHIIVVRLSTIIQEALYLKNEYALVAISRHTESMKYYTPVQTDTLSKFILDYDANEVRRIAGGGKKTSNHDYILEYTSGGFTGKRPITKDGKELFERAEINAFGYLNAHTKLKKITCIDEVRNYSKIPKDIEDFSDNSTIDDKLTNIQCAFDNFLPENSKFDNSDDQELVTNNDLSVDIGDIKMSTFINPLQFIKEKFVHLKSKLRTSCPPKRLTTLKEALLGLQKRNANVPELQGENDSFELAYKLFESFVDTYVDKTKLNLFNEYAATPISVCKRSLEEWFYGSKFGKLSYLKNEDDLDFFSMQLNKYSFSIKPTPKPTQSISAPYDYQATQTIAAHAKYINTVICPLVKQMKQRLTVCLDKRFAIFGDMSLEDFEEKINAELPVNVLEKLEQKYKLVHKEVDISKYDKSQGKTLLIFECMVWHRLGAPQDFVKFWYEMHKSATLVDRTNYLKYYVNYQRKSGEGNTFFGNTICTMAAMSLVYNNFIFGVFAGDDSYLILNNEPETDVSSVLSNILNFETKVFSFKNAYFCSKFLLRGKTMWYFVPDVLKVVNKLGRGDVLDFEHLEEYRVSLADNLKTICNEECVTLLVEALSERYNSSYDSRFLIYDLINLVNDKEQFANVFYEPEHYQKPDKSRHRIDLSRNY